MKGKNKKGFKTDRLREPKRKRRGEGGEGGKLPID